MHQHTRVGPTHASSAADLTSWRDSSNRSTTETTHANDDSAHCSTTTFSNKTAAATTNNAGGGFGAGADDVGEHAPRWLGYYHPPGDGVFFNLQAIEDLIAGADTLSFVDSEYDAYYDVIPSENEAPCMRSVPSAARVRAAWQRLAARVATDHEVRSVLVEGGCTDMLVEVIQLGVDAQRLGTIDDNDLTGVVVAARACARGLVDATSLASDADVESVLDLLRSPDKLRAVLTLRDHIDVLEVLVQCAKNLMIELSLPVRTPSPDEHAARSEALLASSLALVGAVSTTAPRAVS